MKRRIAGCSKLLLSLSVPSTRAYAMKRFLTVKPFDPPDSFSTLNSGLRDETGYLAAG